MFIKLASKTNNQLFLEAKIKFSFLNKTIFSYKKHLKNYKVEIIGVSTVYSQNIKDIDRYEKIVTNLERS